MITMLIIMGFIYSACMIYLIIKTSAEYKNKMDCLDEAEKELSSNSEQKVKGVFKSK